MSNNIYINNNKYFKSNYSKALEHIVPKYLLFDDAITYDEEYDVKDEIINSNISLANNISSVLNISAISNTAFSSINSFDGIYRYFIKQNDLTNINANDFYLNILDKVGTSFSEFKNTEEFKDYLLDTLLPSIRLNSPTSYFNQGSPASASHIELIQDLSWLYFLNTSGPVTNVYDEIADLISNKLFLGSEINLNDCIKLLMEFLWKNNYTSYYPSVFVSSTGKYESGTQQLDKLKTWIDIVYSNLYADKADFTVRDRFYLFKDNNQTIKELVSKGPFYKLLKTLSFAAFDYDNDIEKLKSLNDIDECSKEQLPLLANLIGWNLFGSDPDRWRLQLKNAVSIYKKAGTKKSLQFALNSIFPKNQFDIETGIKELWECYLPNLIYYSLATESTYFTANDIGARSEPNFDLQGTLIQLGVSSGFSTRNLDHNIRLATDAILLDLYNSFSGSFISWRSYEGPFVFYYRNREYPIPPFEEYPYYVNVEFNYEMIQAIMDRLVCFGVPRSFAEKVRDYITENIIDTDEEIRASSWLFFTSGYTPPPNLEDLILNSNSNRSEYASLWSGKSSHFKLDLNSSNFDFGKKIDEVGSGGAVILASKAINEFSPAHAIPLINLNLSSIDKVESEEYNLPIVNINGIEVLETNKIQSNYQASALNIGAYKRNTGVGTNFNRFELNTLASKAYTNSVSLNSIPRNSIRRRNYDKLLPKNGYYDRTGFNMPVSFDMSSSLSGIPLGFIPSSLKFESITNYIDLPEIYSTCQNLNSNKSFYGYNVSNTTRCRGHLPISYFSSNDYYIDRSQLPEIFQTMHRVGESKKVYPSIKNFSGTPAVQFLWKNVYRSGTNLEFISANSFPASMNDYTNFKFGKDLHKLYQIYTKEFNRHTLTDYILDLDGNNFTSHVYGPLIYNYDFDTVNSSYVTSSLEEENLILDKDNIFSIAAVQLTNLGTYVQSSLISTRTDFVNSSMINGMDLIMTSSTNLASDYFSIFRVASKNKIFGTSDYMYDRTFLKMSTVAQNGINSQRLRINVCYSSIPTANGYPSSRNFLLPEHEFKLKINGLMSSYNGLILGGGGVGSIIHTKPVNNAAWFYGLDGHWHYESLEIDGFMRNIQNYLHKYTYNDIVRQHEEPSGPSIIRLNCIDIVQNRERTVTPLLTFSKDDFFECEFNFHTYNPYFGKYSKDYYLSSNFETIHSKTQDYFIEIFPIVNNITSGENKKFLLLDKVEIIDSTMNTMASVISSDDNECPANRVYLEEVDLRNIFKFWNYISGKNSGIGLASRVASGTSSVLLSDGGSRLDYKLSVDWLQAGTSTKYTTVGNILNTFKVPV